MSSLLNIVTLADNFCSIISIRKVSFDDMMYRNFVATIK